MKNILQILTIFIIMFLLTNCDKRPYYKFNQDAKDFFIFKKGSWWLYENDLTHERDCLYIEKAKFDLKVPSNTGYFYDLVLTNFTSKDSLFYGDATYSSNIGDETKVRDNIIYVSLSKKYSFSDNYIVFPLIASDTTYSHESDEFMYKTQVKYYYEDNNLISSKYYLKYKNDEIVSRFFSKTTREINKGVVEFYHFDDSLEFKLKLIDYNIQN